LVLANAGLPHRAATRSFAEGLGWLAQIGLFVLLGLLVTPHKLGSAVLPALGVGLVLLLVARPLAVWLCLLPFRYPVNEQLFLSWAGLRGAVPIVLATFAVVRGVPDSDHLLNVVFVLVVIFTLVQGPSLYPLARWLRISPKESTRELMVEAAPLDVLDAELITMTIPPGSRLHSTSILELDLPTPSVVTLVIRNGKTFVPGRDTQLRTGDELLIVTTRSGRDRTEQRLRAVSRAGPLAHWFNEYGEQG
jgi:cell volume regulation protein A